MSPLKMKRVQSAQVTKVHRSMSDKSITIGDVYDEPRHKSSTNYNLEKIEEF